MESTQTIHAKKEKARPVVHLKLHHPAGIFIFVLFMLAAILLMAVIVDDISMRNFALSHPELPAPPARDILRDIGQALFALGYGFFMFLVLSFHFDAYTDKIVLKPKPN
jgi:hypothetical protein